MSFKDANPDNRSNNFLYKDDTSKFVLVSSKDDSSILSIFHLLLATDVDPNYGVLSFKRSYFNFRVTIFRKDAVTHIVPSSFKRYYPYFGIWSLREILPQNMRFYLWKMLPFVLMYYWLLKSPRLVKAHVK